jgi:Na+/citrate or Na+/malate symporter
MKKDDSNKIVITIMLLVCLTVAIVYYNYERRGLNEGLLAAPLIITPLTFFIYLISEKETIYKKQIGKIALFTVIMSTIWCVVFIFLTALGGAFSHG